MLWDYSTESTKDKSCLYYLLNSKDINNVIRIISNNSKIDLMRYTQEYTPERRGNELLNNAVHKFIDFADSYVEETMLSQAENQIISGNDEALKKYEYISSKARTISHDIKNHLSVIDLYSKIIEKRLDMVCNKELQDSLNNAISSVRKSKEAIDSLLSELRTIKSVNLQTFEFSSLLENVLSLAQAKAIDAGVEIQVATEYKGNILIDEQKFLNVVINLLYNAIEASESNGFIRISTEETENNMLKILFTDNGCGIDADKQIKIFDEGYRPHPLNRRGFRGTCQQVREDLLPLKDRRP